MSIKRVVPVLIFSVLISSTLYTQTPFSLDSAVFHLHYLTNNIGPRPATSPNERKALIYSKELLSHYGYATYIMEFTHVLLRNKSVNGTSGVAYGIKQGKSNKIIVIGAHIDSASPDVPGAIDNASGVACVLELARVFSTEQLYFTLVICLFGAEELGSQGSQYFVEHFPLIDSVVLMLQVDMANGTKELMPLVDSKSHNSPPWLVKAIQNALLTSGYSGLWYPIHFFTFNRIFQGKGIGSDHQSFLEKGIPAICLSSSMNEPLHTVQDNFEAILPSGLKRSGDVLYTLVHSIGSEVPKKDLTPYIFITLGTFLIFIPQWAALILIVTGLIVAFVLCFNAKKQAHTQTVQYSTALPGIKMFLMLLSVVSIAWLSENFVSTLKGVRYPWIINLKYYIYLGLLTGTFTFTVFLNLIPNAFAWCHPKQWFFRASLLLSANTLLLLFLDFRLALYPSISLLSLGIIHISNRHSVQYFVWFISSYLLFRLMFSEGFHFIARLIALHEFLPKSITTLSQMICIVVLTYWLYPSLLIFAGISSRYTNSQYFKALTSLKSIGFQFICIVTSFFILLHTPSYSEQWQQNITVEYRSDNSTTATLCITSPEYLTGTKVHSTSFDTTIVGTLNDLHIPIPAEKSTWLTELITTQGIKCDTTIQYTLNTNIYCTQQPMELSFTLRTQKPTLREVYSPWYIHRTSHSFQFLFTYPNTHLFIPAVLELSNPDTIHVHIEALFPLLPHSITVTKPLANCIPRTRLEKHLTFYCQ
ncbi:MAG: M28 family peptidase [Bacteroidetes bacterium]|nr:M28 family peptidase [Bacteroidota bacterium]